jgi:DNA-binding NarL/FixJ family response regulator
MTNLLLVDDASALAELFADAINLRLGYDVTVAVSLEGVEGALTSLDELTLAIVDLSFPQENGTGIDALAEVHSARPSALLAIITQGDDWVAQILRDAWELLPIATVISKSAPLSFQLNAIDQVVRTGVSPIDPAIQPLLPAKRSPYRTAERFGALVQHAGHVKLWTALMATPDPTYKQISDLSGLKLNTVKNYRAQLLPELSVHGLTDPSLRQMQEFARRCRSFLTPFLDRPSTR